MRRRGKRCGSSWGKSRENIRKGISKINGQTGRAAQIVLANFAGVRSADRREPGTANWQQRCLLAPRRPSLVSVRESRILAALKTYCLALAVLASAALAAAPPADRDPTFT